MSIPFIERKKRKPEWYVCILSHGDVIKVSYPIYTQCHDIVFDEEFCFDNMTEDFEIDVKVYAMKEPPMGALRTILYMVNIRFI